jgi:hypothetical protein
MATERSFQRLEQLPPEFLAQFYSGVPGSNVPGIMPLLNQELVNRMTGFGVEGANPYTYSGQRIADFSPAEAEGMRMTAEGMGSYLPYFQKAEQMTQGGLDAATGAYGDTRDLIGKAVQSGEMSTQEAMGLLRQAPEVAADATRRGLGQVSQAGGTLGAAEQIAGGAGVDLGEAQNIVRGADPRAELGEAQDIVRGADPRADIQRAQQMTLGSQFDPTAAGGVIGGSLGRLGESATTGYGATGQFDPTGIGGFYNPFEDQVVDQTMKDVREGLAKGDIARRAGAIGAGAFGGSRSRLQGQELAEAAARGAAEQVGAIRSGGYQDAARRAQAAFEAQQGRQAGQANLLAGLGAQQANIGSQLGQLGMGAAASNRATAGQFGQMGLAGQGADLARGQALGQMGLSGSGADLARGQALGQMGLAGQGAQLGQAGALGQLAGQRAGMGGQIAGMGGNLAGLYGTAAGGLGSLGGNLANIYGGAGRDVFGSGAQLGQLGMGAGTQMAGLGQGASGLLGTDIARMMSMGAQQRGMDQRGLDLDYGNFVGQYNQPLQTIGQIGGMASGWAPAMGSTTLQQGQTGDSSNPLMQAAGTALTAYGAFNR